MSSQGIENGDEWIWGDNIATAGVLRYVGEQDLKGGKGKSLFSFRHI